MSMEIGGIGSVPVPGITPASTPPATTPANGPAAGDEAVAVDVQSLPDGPPPEVSAAITVASQAYDRLAAGGRHVRFSTDPSSGELSIELQSDDGSSQPITAADALRLADGGSID